jgi:uroporphyrin-3 C-methyltransferase
MTETSPDLSRQASNDGQNAQAAPAAAQSSGGAKPAKSTERKPRKGGGLLKAFILLLVVAAALAAALWNQYRESQITEKAFASQIGQLNHDLAQARQTGSQALALAQSQTGQVTDLENRIREVQTQNSALQQAWQSFSSGGSDEMLLNDVERSVDLANQQLRLAGDVSNAIVALETAQSRLAQANRPSLASLQQSINGDLDRLRAVSTVDVPTQTARLERLMDLVGRAPMLVPGAAATQAAPEVAAPVSPAEQAAASLPADASWWMRWRAEMATWPARAASVMVREFGDLIRVQRVARPDAILLSPEQTSMVRATLRQRLMTAQLALMMRQQPVWKTELDNVQDTLAHYYDTHTPDVMSAQDLAHQLGQTEISVRLPDISDTLNALAALRSAAAKSGQDAGAQDAAPKNGQD